MSVLFGPHVEKLKKPRVSSALQLKQGTMSQYTVSNKKTYLRRRKGQDFHRSTLWGHGLISVRRQGSTSPASTGQYGRRGQPSRRNGDEFPFAASAQLLQSISLETKLVALRAGIFLRKVKGCEIAPAVQVLKRKDRFYL